jgi:hypothetical protein
MPFYLNIDGRDVRCDTATEAAALLRATAKTATKEPKSPKAGDSKAERPAASTGDELRFLAAVDNAGDAGIGGERLMRAIGCANQQALSAIMKRTWTQVEAAGIERREVAERERSGDNKVWRRRGQIKVAMKALEG